MRNRTGGQGRLEEAFRQELFRLINQYLSFPDDATWGAIARTLINFQQASALLEAYDSRLIIVDELLGKQQPCTRRRDEVRARRKEEIKGLAARKETVIL